MGRFVDGKLYRDRETGVKVQIVGQTEKVITVKFLSKGGYKTYYVEHFPIYYEEVC